MGSEAVTRLIYGWKAAFIVLRSIAALLHACRGFIGLNSCTSAGMAPAAAIAVREHYNDRSCGIIYMTKSALRGIAGGCEA
jgi:hypothetical protein